MKRYQLYLPDRRSFDVWFHHDDDVRRYIRNMGYGDGVEVREGSRVVEKLSSYKRLHGDRAGTIVGV